MPILTPEERFGQRVAERYRLLEVLSTGGMGVVFRALDEASGEHVAVKMLKPVYALEPDRVARFMRETRIAAELRHPNLVPVREVGSDESGVPFLIMELLEGRSLAQELDARVTLAFDEALSIVVPIIDALAAAHAVGIIHRDIKPSNIFLCSDGAGRVVPKLLDFGIAKSQSDDFETQTGLMLGTPGYMAPEQAQLGECSAATDVWGVGAVLYHCLMGHPPHASDSMPEQLRKLIREPVPPLVGVGVTKPAGATIDRALVRDPNRRYASMHAFGRALAAAAAHEYRESSCADRETVATKSQPLADHGVLPARAPRRVWQRVLPLAGGLLLCILLLAWTLEPKRAVGDQATVASAGLQLTELYGASEARPMFTRAQARSEVISTSAISSSPDGPGADRLQRSTRRGLRRKADARTHPRDSTGAQIDRKVSPPEIVEPETTTGLPVATEW
jgi:hypothetical protein